MDKKNTINTLDSINLTSLVKKLIELMGFSNVQAHASTISASFDKDPFTPNKQTLFLIFSKKEVSLENLQDAQKVKQQIEAVQGKFDEYFIVSNQEKIADHFKDKLVEVTQKRNFKYMVTNNLVEYTETYMPQYWTHQDNYLHTYEKKFMQFVEDDFELHSLKLDEKYKQSLKIFIEPKLRLLVMDKEQPGKEHKDASQNKPKFIPKPIKRTFIHRKGNFVLSGDAGTGKSTLLKQIGTDIIKSNEENGSEKKSFPICIKQLNLTDNNYSIELAMCSILEQMGYTKTDIETISANYQIVLLIDSIDEFDIKNQKDIIKELDKLASGGIRYCIATRNFEYFTDVLHLKSKHDVVLLFNFNLKQSEQFISKFFQNDLQRANRLLDALKENNILEKLPITPLTLSLISILYEEKQYEIPATITDIYDNFNRVLLGKSIVLSSLDFLDTTIKERVLSQYALKMLQTPEKTPLTTDEFKVFVRDFFKNRNSSFDESNTEKILNYLVKNTDILIISLGKYVKFKHDSFMEYYASVEIHKYQRNLEQQLIDQFTDFNWQNTTIFYAGHTKDMPDFLERIIAKTYEYDKFIPKMMGIIGLGHICQALYLTPENTRQKAVTRAIDLNLNTLEPFKFAADSKADFFSGISLPDIYLMNLLLFHASFNSVTLKNPLRNAFNEIFASFQPIDPNAPLLDHNLFYKLFNLAALLANDRIQDSEAINLLFEFPQLLNNPIAIILFDRVFEELKIENKKEIQSKLTKKKHRLHEALHFYLTTPASKLRSTTYDKIIAESSIKIFTEGETDPRIIDKAYRMLTNNAEPYWTIKSIEQKNGKGGATLLSKFLSCTAANTDNDQFIIGIFDNDSRGHQEFMSLKAHIFDDLDPCIKKHKEANIYAIKLPISVDKQEKYCQEKNEFKFFEIEHYFPEHYLKEHNMLKTTPIPGIFEIGGSKTKFADIVVKETNIDLFLDFIYLFEMIDGILGKKIEYEDGES